MQMKLQVVKNICAREFFDSEMFYYFFTSSFSFFQLPFDITKPTLRVKMFIKNKSVTNSHLFVNFMKTPAKREDENCECVQVKCLKS